ncbi:hypothetical protein GE09DRAFT_305838 [Coniochaeta sp. 2T2.1]|nr:hypothetical protein GE09DRAFT_305838 [Coniochaeta sp. 2T2.1]
MDAIKKIIHPHKHSHHEHESTSSTSTSAQQENVLRNRDTGENMANPFMAQNTAKAEQFRQTHHHSSGDTSDKNVPGTNPLHPVEGSYLGQHSSTHTHSATPAGESAGPGASRLASVKGALHLGHQHNTHSAAHDDHHPTGTTTKGTHEQQPNAPTGIDFGSGSGHHGKDDHVPGVNTGGTKVVEARMPVEEGNNFPPTNPNPAHSMLGTREERGWKFAGSG